MSPRPRSPLLDRACAACGSPFRGRFANDGRRFCSQRCAGSTNRDRAVRRPVIDRLMDRVVEDENGCWIWQGCKHKGYGQIAISAEDGRKLTHRVTYEYFIAEIPDGLELDHLCVNPPCCNPWHLEPVTHLVNVQRAEKTGRRVASYRKALCRNGHEYTPENTHITTSGARRCRACSAEWARNRRAAA